MAKQRENRRLCWAVTKTSGTCDNCGFVITPRQAFASDARHNGQCPKCGVGIMRCTTVVNSKAVHCPHHRWQESIEDAAKIVGSHREESHRRGLLRHLPPEVQRMFVEAYNDPRLLSLRDDIAIFVTRQYILADRLESGESSAVWRLLLEVKGEFEAANRSLSEARNSPGLQSSDEAVFAAASGDVENAKKRVETSLRSMLKLIDGANEREDAWEELLSLTERAAELKRAQHGRLKDLKHYVSAEQATHLIGGVVTAIRACVRDQRMLEEIESKLAEVLRLPSASRLPLGTIDAAPVDRAMSLPVDDKNI
jgi:hypothetical protein